MRARRTGTAASIMNGCTYERPAGFGVAAMATSWMPNLDIVAIERRSESLRGNRSAKKRAAVTLPTLKFLETKPS